MSACPDCDREFASEALLLMHRQFEHPEAVEAEGSAAALQEAAVQEEGRFTSDGFLKRVGARPDPQPTDNAGLLDSIFPSADPGAALPPWERERLSGPS
jgi:hypothetical protein